MYRAEASGFAARLSPPGTSHYTARVSRPEALDRKKWLRALRLCVQGRAVQDVGFADLDPVESEGLHALDQDGGAGDDGRGSVGVEPRQLASLVERHRGQPLEQLAAAVEGQPVAVRG